MRQAALAACAVLGAACAGDVDPDGSLECPCGSESTNLARPESFDQTLAEFTEYSCAGVRSFRGVCADGKSVLYVNGGFGHTAHYFVDQRRVGTSRSSDVRIEGCPANTYDGSLEAVTCELISAEPLCPGSPYPGGSLLPESLAIPYADGELSPWCDRER
jgi:hypothetical protein